MDDEIDRLVVGVRADTAGFARDVAAMRREMEPLQAGADRAGRAIETALVRASRSGKLGFQDLRQVAVTALNEIAASAIRGGIGAALGSGGVAGGLGSGLLSTLFGLIDRPGRAIGGPVSGGRPYLVGERGPELFVPGAGGRVVPMQAAASAPREVRVAISVAAEAGAAPAALARSSRQVARAVRAALAEEG